MLIDEGMLPAARRSRHPPGRGPCACTWLRKRRSSPARKSVRIDRVSADFLHGALTLAGMSEPETIWATHLGRVNA